MDAAGNAAPFRPHGVANSGPPPFGSRAKTVEHQARHYSRWKHVCKYILNTLLALSMAFLVATSVCFLLWSSRTHKPASKLQASYAKRVSSLEGLEGSKNVAETKFFQGQRASSRKALAVQAPKSLRGPTIPFNFPDPAILSYAGMAYAFGTNTPTVDSVIHVQVATSTDNMTWSLHSAYDALPDPGPWALAPGIWAPDVVAVSETTFVMYYSAPSKRREGTHCVGAAVSPPYTPLGPYYPLPEPIACPMDEGGAIDPDGFLDPSNGKRYVIYKVDGNNIGHGGSCRNTVPPLISTPIRLQEVSSNDGVTPIGGPITILERIDEDGPLIEAPSLYRTSWGVYFLFYSSGCYTGESYDVKYATATDIRGPWTRAASPLLSSGIQVGQGASTVGLVGPGGMDVLMPSASQPAQYRPIAGRHPDLRRAAQVEETPALFHGILADAQLPDGYDFTDSVLVGTGSNIGGWREPAVAFIEEDRQSREFSSFPSKQSLLNTKPANPGRISVRDTVMPIRPHGVVRGLYQGQIRFEGTNAFFV